MHENQKIETKRSKKAKMIKKRCGTCLEVSIKYANFANYTL